MPRNDLIVAWLNDAHAMELGIAQVLENHAASAADHPEMQARLEQHLEQTRRHADLVKSCVERLGGDTSAVKTGMASVMGTIQGMSTKIAKDELIKNTLHDYGTEHFEMACYTSLLAAAEDLGDMETAQVCRQILRDEQAMADFLFQQIPTATLEMLHLEAATASR
ncbi:MAG: ferritin-like domain-containing protein [Chloroflexia bacterium]|nr:ferritin-like domain-containing protein [Chloroflexia bacterium]